MNIAFVGCGYVAESYTKTLVNYPELKLSGVFDRNQSNLETFVRRWNVRNFASFDQLLADREIEMVLNLTNPRSHYEVTRKCLEAGKHVYSEKPLAMEYEQACQLVDLARMKGVYLASAPCSVLSETAQRLWKALRENVIGKVRLVYGNFDDGMIAPKQSPWNWRNESGVAWPAKDEFDALFPGLTVSPDWFYWPTPDRAEVRIQYPMSSHHRGAPGSRFRPCADRGPRQCAARGGFHVLRPVFPDASGATDKSCG